ncbi:methyltransferase [Streptomyces sp. NPDC035033]|uniref:methyltransferase n=1 Tax=Streptomyces sp. NPDC035033 TaxID=3155368 RepID=UPI00340E2305
MQEPPTSQDAPPRPAHAGARPDLDLWRLGDLVTPMAVRTAATLAVADHILAGRSGADALARATGVDAGALGRVLDHLVTVGLLRYDDGAYELTDRGAVLRSDHPSGMRHLWDLEGAVGRADLSLVELPAVVATGSPGYPRRFGRGFWDDLAARPELARSFTAQMANVIARDSPAIAAAYDWSALGSVVDVGGGSGELLAALLTAHPTLRGTVLDLPGVAEEAKRTLGERDVDARADVVAGSFFDPLPAGAGGYVLSSVLHDWDDDACGAVLSRCAEAAGEDGRVFVIEQVGEDGRNPNTVMDLRMLTFFGGKERTLDELAGLAEHAGLAYVAAHPTAGQVAARSVIEFVPGTG